MRSKSRSGCQTCKRRRVKCDETSPACGNCTQKGFDCPGYTQRIKRSTKHETSTAAQDNGLANTTHLITIASKSLAPIVPGSGPVLPGTRYERNATTRGPEHFPQVPAVLQTAQPHLQPYNHDAAYVEARYDEALKSYEERIADQHKTIMDIRETFLVLQTKFDSFERSMKRNASLRDLQRELVPGGDKRPDSVKSTLSETGGTHKLEAIDSLETEEVQSGFSTISHPLPGAFSMKNNQLWHHPSPLSLETLAAPWQHPSSVPPPLDIGRRCPLDPSVFPLFPDVLGSQVENAYALATQAGTHPINDLQIHHDSHLDGARDMGMFCDLVPNHWQLPYTDSGSCVAMDGQQPRFQAPTPPPVLQMLDGTPTNTSSHLVLPPPPPPPPPPQPQPQQAAGLLAKNTQTAILLNRCDLLHPRTVKPCNKNYSRQFDLRRHWETVHESKRKVRCGLCVDAEFNRTDALLRHHRHCHPDDLVQCMSEEEVQV